MSTLIENFIGPTFVMLCLAFVLYGAFCAQMCYYFANYNDSTPLQCFVALIAVLETAHMVLSIYMLYAYLVIAWGNLLAAAKIIPTVSALIYFNIIIISLVQGWYIHRIWCLKKRIIPVISLAALLCVCFGLELRETVHLSRFGLWLELYGSKQFSKELNVAYSALMVLDISITSVLTFYLLSDRSKVVKRSVRKMITGLVHFSLSSGILITLTSCGIIISLNATKESITFGGIAQFLTKLHANSMLAALNSRKIVLNNSTSDTMFGVELSNLQSSSHSDAPSSTRKPFNSIHIRKQTERTTSADDPWPGADKEREGNRLDSEAQRALEEV